MIDAQSTALLIHLLSAIIFLGYIFTEVLFLQTSSQEASLKQQLVQKRKRILPVVFVTLFGSGAYMMTQLVKAYGGSLPDGSSLKLLLIIKMASATVILAGFVLVFLAGLVKLPIPTFFQKHGFKLVLACGLVVVVLAKVMFLFN